MHDHAAHSGATLPDPRDLTGPFRHSVEIVVRFADTDAMGHVNNAKYLTYFEIARVAYYDITGNRSRSGRSGGEHDPRRGRITYRARRSTGRSSRSRRGSTRIGRTSVHWTPPTAARGRSPGSSP